MHSLLLIAALIGPPTGEDLAVARAVITDAHGQPVPTEMPLGEAVVFSARRSVHGSSPQSVKWLISPPERDSRKYVSPDGIEVFVPTGSVDVTIEAILAVSLGDTVDVMKLSVKCGKGAQPPPDPKPKPPPPDPKPDPPPVVHESLTVIVVDDFTEIAPDTAIVKNSTYWDKLKAAGHSWAWYSAGSREGKAFMAVEALGVPLPALIVFDKKTNQKLTAQKLPKDVTALDTLLKLYSGKSVLGP